ncbi:MAG: alpha,alpha-trehalase TreA [Candidatus Dadabacteria bacterium]
MRKFLLSVFSLVIVVCSFSQVLLPPDQLFGELFRDVQMSRIFPDSKTFVDATARRDPASIVADYLRLKYSTKQINLPAFVEENFYIPKQLPSDYHSATKDVVKHINDLWTVLRRKSDSANKWSSILPLPYEYIIPGGRFREVYYWDSYFTCLGLKESKRLDLVEDMVLNFAHLINTYGHMPNGNRTYYLSRSQPPFFSLMVGLLAELKGKETYIRFLPQMEKEYQYWMDKSAPTKHVVKMPDGSTLNRYYDQLSIPRQESYREDYLLGKHVDKEHERILYRNFRSAAESGWDFSSRWFKDGRSLSTIQTISIVPVDLNCLLYHLEQTLGKSYRITGNNSKAKYYHTAAAKRKAAINKYCWLAAKKWYVDYNLITRKRSSELTLAGMFPYFLQLSTTNKMMVSTLVLEKNFLKAGGVVTTLKNTGQQWDAPNGWAPLQWVTIIGLENYGQKQLGRMIAQRWVSLNKRVFESTGKLVEKYDVIDMSKSAGGGEYPSQDGFGWTNGVLLALMKKYSLE